MSIGGGAWTNENNGLNEETGWCSVPHFGKNPESGAQVFVFFEAGDINKPVYFASAQSGPGWFSEHPNQHVFQSDNIRIRIDEEPSHPNSTCQFNSYNDQNCEASILDGTKTETQTRLDIEILAEDLNAVNIQIHGDVNMKVLGDWYVHHEGAKHETHIGPTYIKHIGNTIIEEEGEYIYKHTGNSHNYIDGSKNETVTENYTVTYQQDFKKNVGGRSIYNYGGDRSTFIGGISQYKIIGNEEKILMGSYTAHLGGDISIDVKGNTNFIAGGWVNAKIVNNIGITSSKGNIDIKTNGEFELLKDGNITAEGYNNIGTKGNIRITSTFGNIGIKTIENKELVDFEQEYTCIPWNPSYLKQMSLLSVIPGFDETMIFNDVSSIGSDLSSLLSNLQKFILFDGCPSFLPCKMILQNPNIKPPTEKNWIKDFRSIDENWNNISNTAYWKILGKLMGNIEISSWNGDISLETYGTLGNAGNINIFAKNKYGILPGYQAGNVKIAADTPFRIFTDPRDLFFDSDLKSKIAGKFIMFSSANGISSTPPNISVFPFKNAQDIIKLLGIPVEFGFTQENSNGGGCIRCICDVLASLALKSGGLSIFPWEQTKSFIDFPLHKFNAISGALIEPNDCSSTNLFESISNGYGHAIDNFKLGETFESIDYPLGDVLINSVGSNQFNSGKNFKITSATKNWNFGVESKVQTGWIEPKIDLTFGDTGFINPLKGLIPTQLNKKITYKNEYNNQIFGNYISNFNTILNTGIYPLGNIGCFGYEDAKYELNTPSISFSTSKMNLLLSANDIITQPYLIPQEFYSNYQLSGINSLENIKIGKLENSYKIKLGDDSLGLTLSGKTDFKKLKEDLPNTAQLVETAKPVISILSNVIPGIGQATDQAIKLLPDIEIPNSSDTFVNSPYLTSLSGSYTQKAFLPHKMELTGGILPFPDSMPILNNINKLGLPDFAKEIDEQLVTGNDINLTNPTQFISDKMMEATDLSLLDTCEVNTKVGTGLPNPINKILNYDEIFVISGGLLPNATLNGNLNVLDGTLVSSEFLASVPTSIGALANRPKFYFTEKILKTGFDISSDISPQESLTLDIFDKTAYTNVNVGVNTGFETGVNIGTESKLKISTSEAEFKLLGLEIFKIPDLLGKSLIDAIRSVFGL